MNTTLASHSISAALQSTGEPFCPIHVEPIGPNNIVRLNQPGHLPILASLTNTWRLTAAKKEINESLQLHFIATTESGQQILIFQDLFSGTWHRPNDTASDPTMVHPTVSGTGDIGRHTSEVS